MSIEFSWKINALKYGNEPGFEHVVQFADCSYVASETVGVTTYMAEERIILDLDPPSADNFSPLNTLTEEQVLEWLAPKFENINEQELLSKQSKLTYIIEEQKSERDTELQSGLPWEPEVVEELPNT
jgi:hypothetical protein